MSGVLFLRTRKLDEVAEFYLRRIGCELWLDQGKCRILRHGNFLLGFCQRDEADVQGCITFFYENRAEVDRMYAELKAEAEAPPALNDEYRVYQFFARDPEGRLVELQYFDHRIENYLEADECLRTRRSVREFTAEPVDDELLNRLLDSCRLAPTARNTESFYFKVIRDERTKEFLAGTRDTSTAPIGRAPLAVAICADPRLSGRHVQDGCIGAYHFLLAARAHGLGTCWIGGMDEDAVKDRLNIPREHYLVTVTPLGFPKEWPLAAPSRKPLGHYIHH